MASSQGMDIVKQMQDEVAILQSDVDALHAQVEEKNEQIRHSKRERIRMRTGLNTDTGGGKAMKDLMNQLRKLQLDVSHQHDVVTGLDDQLDHHKLELSKAQKTLEGLDDDRRDVEELMQREDRKFAQTHERLQTLKQEVERRTARVDEQEASLQLKEEEMQAERRRAGMGDAHKMAEDLAELDRLKELLTGLEEEMADADDALSEKTDDLRSQEQDTAYLKQSTVSLTTERQQMTRSVEQLKIECEQLRQDHQDRTLDLKTITADVHFITVKLRDTENECERQRARARALADDAQSNDLQKRRSRQDLEVLILQSREREGLLRELRGKHAAGKESLERCEHVLAKKTEQLKNADQIANRRVEMLERQVELKREIRQQERETIEAIDQRIRRERERDIDAARFRTAEQVRQIDNEVAASNLGKRSTN